MNFDDWEPIYEAILTDFGFERRADERARDLLASVAEPFSLDRFSHVDGATVAIAGAAPTLVDDFHLVRRADVVFAASTAADVLTDAGFDVELMVTDLDKNPDTVRTLTDRGVPVAVHAHGDNVPALRAHVPTFDRSYVLATTQARPRGPVVNFGGFTDGDRTAFIADHLGAERLVFPGWEFDDPTVDAEKRRKLGWAERLLYWLERRRTERFSILDGRRNAIDTTVLPID